MNTERKKTVTLLTGIAICFLLMDCLPNNVGSLAAVVVVLIMGTFMELYQITNSEQLSIIIQKLKTMSEALDAIKSDLVATKAIVIKVKADVDGLHAKLDALGDAPTPEQLAEVKALSAELVTSLQAVDDETEDAPPVEG